jgi:hypothetical protein
MRIAIGTQQALRERFPFPLHAAICHHGGGGGAAAGVQSAAEAVPHAPVHISPDEDLGRDARLFAADGASGGIGSAVGDRAAAVCRYDALVAGRV